MILDHAVALAQLRLEERADARLEEHVAATQVGREQTATGQRNAVLVVGLDPFRPHRLGSISKHGSPVQSLGIPFNGPKLHAKDSSALPRDSRGANPDAVGGPEHSEGRGTGMCRANIATPSSFPVLPSIEYGLILCRAVLLFACKHHTRRDTTNRAGQ